MDSEGSMKYLNLFICASLSAFAFSVVWLFATHRLYEPDPVYWWTEIIFASVFGIIGLIAIELNIRRLI